MESAKNQNSRFHRKAIHAEEAWHRIEPYIAEGEIEEIALADACGRRLAEDVAASHPLPPFCRSGMDGFSIQSADTADASTDHPVFLEVIDNIPCGAVPAKPVVSGTASRTMTGAMVPDGADAVIMLEMTDEAKASGREGITIRRPVQAGENISPAGSEVERGAPLLERGRLIQAGEMAVLAAFGHAKVKVFRRPAVAIIATGSELLDVHEKLQPGKIRNSNAYMLAALVQQAGGVPLIAQQIPDDAKLAGSRLDETMEQADMVITSGGVSVGDLDILVDYFEQWDGHMLFNKLTMRPGSPTTVGVRNGKFLFALSGNPGACFVGFKLFIQPVLLGMQGNADGRLRASSAWLAADFPKINNYTRYVRGQTGVKDGKVYAAPVGRDQSSIMVSIKDADCLIVVPPTRQGLKAGEQVEILKLYETGQTR